jgi:hypothetical protein
MTDEEEKFVTHLYEHFKGDEEDEDDKEMFILLYKYLNNKEMTDEEKEKFLRYILLKENSPAPPFFMDTLFPIYLLFDDPKAMKQTAKVKKKGNAGPRTSL